MNEEHQVCDSRKVSDLIKYFDNILCEIEAGKSRRTSIKTNVNNNRISNNNLKNAEKESKSCKIIEELLKTEETYFQTLRHIIGNYIFYFKQELNKNIFKALEDLGRYQVTFYVDLIDSQNDTEKIGECFLKHKQLFHHYKIYIGEMYDLFNTISTKYNKLVEARRKQLGDCFRLADQLLTPFQRLTRYILILRNLLENQTNTNNKTLKESINYLESITTEINRST